LDAGKLYEKARNQDPSISLSTVYRNLRLFRELGFIEERHFVTEHHYYEAKPSVEHHHLICLSCGRIIEFTSPLARQIGRQAGTEHAFTVTGVEIRMEGYCHDCRGSTGADQTKPTRG
jgi:Fur family ferric uptake transcriptional regulator